MGVEIERKFLIQSMPEHLEEYPCHLIEQGYLCTEPVIRIRKQDAAWFLTYKGRGFMEREEYNLLLNEDAYHHLAGKIDGTLISKKRYYIPLEHGWTAELDLFDAPFAPLTLVEVEFPTREAAMAFVPPNWFGEEVTKNPAYHNSALSKKEWK